MHRRRMSELELQLDERRVEGSGQAFNSQQIQHLKALIASELQMCRQSLIADQRVAMKNCMAALETRFEAVIQERHDLDKSANLQRLEERFSNTRLHLDTRLDALASQQMSKYLEYRYFQQETLTWFERFAESINVLNQERHSMKLMVANILPVNEPVAKTEHHGSAEPDATERGMPESTTYHGITSSLPERGEMQHERSNAAPSPGATPGATPKKSARVKAVEMAVASMQQHEQEQIRSLQQQICELQSVQETFQNSKPATNSRLA
jgi:hypothetical protein